MKNLNDEQEKLSNLNSSINVVMTGITFSNSSDWIFTPLNEINSSQLQKNYFTYVRYIIIIIQNNKNKNK